MDELREGMVAKQHGGARQYVRTRPGGKHVYIIGQLFDPWEDWTAECPCRAHDRMALEVSNSYPPALQSEAGLCSLSCLSLTSLVEVSRVPEPGSGAPTHSLGNLEMRETLHWLHVEDWST